MCLMYLMFLVGELEVGRRSAQLERIVCAWQDVENPVDVYSFTFYLTFFMLFLDINFSFYIFFFMFLHFLMCLMCSGRRIGRIQSST